MKFFHSLSVILCLILSVTVSANSTISLIHNQLDYPTYLSLTSVVMRVSPITYMNEEFRSSKVYIEYVQKDNSKILEYQNISLDEARRCQETNICDLNSIELRPDYEKTTCSLNISIKSITGIVLDYNSIQWGKCLTLPSENNSRVDLLMHTSEIFLEERLPDDLPFRKGPYKLNTGIENLFPDTIQSKFIVDILGYNEDGTLIWSSQSRFKNLDSYTAFSFPHMLSHDQFSRLCYVKVLLDSRFEIFETDKSNNYFTFQVGRCLTVEKLPNLRIDQNLLNSFYIYNDRLSEIIDPVSIQVIGFDESSNKTVDNIIKINKKLGLYEGELIRLSEHDLLKACRFSITVNSSFRIKESNYSDNNLIINNCNQ